MRKSLLPLLAPLALAAGFAFGPGPAPASVPGPGAIAEMIKQYMKALDAGDAQAATAYVVAKGCRMPLLLYGLHGEKAEGHDGLLAAIPKIGKGTTKLSAMHADCHSPELGYATFEYERELADKTLERARVTVLAQWEKERQWRFFHWHASPAASPLPAQKVEK